MKKVLELEARLGSSEICKLECQRGHRLKSSWVATTNFANDGLYKKGHGRSEGNGEGYAPNFSAGSHKK